MESFYFLTRFMLHCCVRMANGVEILTQNYKVSWENLRQGWEVPSENRIPHSGPKMVERRTLEVSLSHDSSQENYLYLSFHLSYPNDINVSWKWTDCRKRTNIFSRCCSTEHKKHTCSLT